MSNALNSPIGLGPESWAPGNKPDPLIQNSSGRIGASVSRVDGPLKVRGKATFAAEFALDGMVYAALVFSTIPKGRIAMLDTSAAEAAPGVVLVMTHLNAPRMRPMPLFGTSEKAAGVDSLPIMQDDRVHWNGQAIAVVLAETREQADHAGSLIRVTYEAEPATTSFERAKANGTDTAWLFGHELHIEIGDAEAVLAAAPMSVDAIYRTPYQNHNAIEPHATTVVWHGDELVMHDASQLVVHQAWSLAHIFGLEEEQVRVTAPYVGGAFGGKGFWSHQVLAAAAAKLAGRPVRLALSREGVYRTVGGRARTEQRVAIGASADGHFDAIIHTGTAVSSRDKASPEAFTFPTQSTYAAGSFEIDLQLAYQDMVANSTMRAPGEAVGSFALESAVDEVAVALGMDPIELRIRNEPDKDPTSGMPFSSRHLVEAWRAGAERFGWVERNPTPGAVRDGEWLVGMGCAAATHLYVRQPGGAARITMTGNGNVTVDVAAHDAGMGTATAQTQVIAERLALDPQQVSFRFADSRMPGLVAALGSSQTVTVGAAVAAAQHALVGELLKLVGPDTPLAGLTTEEVGALDGGLAKLDEPTRHQSYGSILAQAGRDEISIEASAPPPLEMMSWSMHSYGAMFCEVRVNAVTGETRVSRFLGSMDCGRVLNSKTATSQFRGGIIMGLGLALTEQTHFDERNGRIMNPSMAEYHIPVHMDVPQIDVIWTDIPDPHAPMGARGIGELSITGTGAAVANAIFNATGKRIRDLPITPDKLM
ncbi:xanthine dehydrogenase family protein molybdopterin-binding subunit [Kibdelosporangium aridum]|uniref:Xanthine dehydrogenase family protein molybdopterin-binding subunit n=1 Tax=Kibdelosporangium aridum TaxID=2030 RepID=A0A428YK05_KIBAR|nr:xanthine dehydrogenase family protein molybdopterin-binding subunit [Kibdelosporangium aridum]RSM67957.1 xanthine dehydrogenase family protein molybdopterin-binding subunit [Kibdelosporangium aridum]